METKIMNGLKIENLVSFIGEECRLSPLEIEKMVTQANQLPIEVEASLSKEFMESNVKRSICVVGLDWEYRRGISITSNISTGVKNVIKVDYSVKGRSGFSTKYFFGMGNLLLMMGDFMGACLRIGGELQILTIGKIIIRIK